MRQGQNGKNREQQILKKKKKVLYLLFVEAFFWYGQVNRFVETPLAFLATSYWCLCFVAAEYALYACPLRYSLPWWIYCGKAMRSSHSIKM